MAIVNCCFLLIFATLCLHCLITFSVATQFKNITTDQSALLVLKSHIMNFDHHDILAKNWSKTSSVCDWIGVTCGSHHKRVTSLNISNMELTGNIPPHIGNLSFLVYLNMSNNYFHGKLPNELSRLHRLRVMSLYSNNFTGSIPSKIFNISSLEIISFARNELSGNLIISSNLTNHHLSNLRVLSMSWNQLSGPLPLSLFQFSQLQFLSLSYNEFSGAIPREIGNLKRITTLYLGANNFHGPIPKEIHQYCSALQVLDFAGNKIDGFISKEIGNLSMLNVLNLGENNLIGPIPTEIGNLSILYLDLFQNNLIGTIPEEITKLKNLDWLNLGKNSLSGSVPRRIFNLSALQLLSIGHNNLSGTLPSNMGHALPNLQRLYLPNTSLTGQLPEFISNASKLIGIYIYENKFMGPIPNSLGDLRLLEVLVLFSNSFTSSSSELTFITYLTNCRHLQVLEISDNPFNGILPISIGNLSTSLYRIRAAGCQIKGNFPNEIGNLSNLVRLVLSNNGFRGLSPEAFYNLQNLQTFSLDNNRIKGYLPTSLCGLNHLGYLDLSQNQFAGPILDCLGNLTSLRIIDISSNSLTSNIPPSLWNLKDLLQLDLSSNSLSGNLPQELENLKVAIYVNLSRNQFTGDIPSTIESMVNLIGFSLADNKLEGPIRESFGKMVVMESLDLSNNNISGEIPKSLEKLNSLKYLNVSFNKLRGEIPTGGPFKNFSYQSFASNEALCGATQFRVPPCDHKRHSFHNSLRTRRLVIIISVIVMSVIFVVILVVLWIIKRKKKVVRQPQVDLLQISTIPGRFSFLQTQRATDFFSQENLLGTGSFGSVYRATFEDGILFAAKVFNLQLEDIASRSFETECEVLRNLRHRNITKVIGVCSNLDFKALVMEYMENGSLENWLYSDGSFLNMTQRVDIMIDVACALEYLHHGYHTPVIHCDLKPSNILLDKDLVGHVTDFGIAKLLGEKESNVHTNTLATLGYIAPEYGTEGLVSSACDVYSYGILLMETFTRRRPNDNMFDGEHLNIKSWIKGFMPNRLSHVVDSNLMRDEEANFDAKIQCASSIVELALNCSAELPRERMSMRDVVTSLKKIKGYYIAML